MEVFRSVTRAGTTTAKAERPLHELHRLLQRKEGACARRALAGAGMPRIAICVYKSAHAELL